MIGDIEEQDDGEDGDDGHQLMLIQLRRRWKEKRW